MANYYKEIHKMMEKLLHRFLTYERTGFPYGAKGEEFALLDLYLLKKIGEGENKKIYEIVRETEVDRGSIAAATNKLVSWGLVDKVKSEEDKRVYILRLTDEGKRVCQKDQEKVGELLEFILADMTVNEEKAVLKFLSRMNQALLKKP